MSVIPIHYSTAPPEVYVFHRPSKTSSDNHTITCLATGFLPKNITMLIQKGSSIELEATELDVLPNGDGKHQARLKLDVPTSDVTEYQCYVDHRKLKKPIVIRFPGNVSFFHTTSI